MIHRIRFILLISIFLSCLVVSCIKDDFSMGNENLKTNFNISVTDTCSVILSTYQDDSIITSGLSCAWIGVYKDDYFGTINATSVIPFTRPSYSIAKNSVYDSTALFVKFTSDYYGDTLKEQNIFVYRISKKIELYNNGYLYNTSSFRYNPIPLDTITFAPRPALKKTISIRSKVLEDSLGRKLFSEYLNNTKISTNDDLFADYFSGLAFVPDTQNNTVINNWMVDDSIPFIRIYYHYKNSDSDVVKTSIEFYPDKSLQFNKVTQRGGFLNKLSGNKNKETVSTATNNMAFLQGITGTHIKIELPYLRDVGMLGEFVEVTAAQLYLKPVFGSYFSKTPLPDTLQYNVLDGSDGSLLSSLSNVVPYIYLSRNILDDENTEYKFNITNYLKLNDQLTAFGVKKYYFTLSSLPFKGRKNPLRRVIIGDQQNSKNKLVIELNLLIYGRQ